MPVRRAVGDKIARVRVHADVVKRIGTAKPTKKKKPRVSGKNLVEPTGCELRTRTWPTQWLVTDSAARDKRSDTHERELEDREGSKGHPPERELRSEEQSPSRRVHQLRKVCGCRRNWTYPFKTKRFHHTARPWAKHWHDYMRKTRGHIQWNGITESKRDNRRKPRSVCQK